MSVFGLQIHAYGLLIALGIALGVALGCAREKQLGLPRDTSVDLALVGVPCAILGARLYFVLFSWEIYAGDPIRILYIWEGGLAIYGGLIGALLGGFAYARIKKLPFARLADLAAPGFAMGQAVGRWGNYVNQEAYGAIARAAWQRVFPIGVYIAADGQWHYATFFYESVWCLIIVALLLFGERRRAFSRDGDTFIAYAFLYALERALVEGLRTDSLYMGPLRISQLLSALAAIACAAVMCFRGREKRWRIASLTACACMAPLALSGRLWPALGCAACAFICQIAALWREAGAARR